MEKAPIKIPNAQVKGRLLDQHISITDALLGGQARKPKLHTVAEARRISRKAKRLGLLAVLIAKRS